MPTVDEMKQLSDEVALSIYKKNYWDEMWGDKWISQDNANNVYDKGHCAPAADFNCNREMLYKTFSYLNCTLQNEKLNRVHWRLLEDYERLLAYSEGPVNVEIKIVFDKSPRRVPGGAAIPTAFYKTIKTKNKTLVFFFYNEAPTKPTFVDYQIKSK